MPDYKVMPDRFICTVTGSSSAAGLAAYAANDMILNSTATGTTIALADVTKGKGEFGYITKAAIVMGGSLMSARLTGFLYNAVPTGGTLMDNAANLHPVTADLGAFQGQIDWVGLSNQGSGDSHAIVTPSTSGNLPLAFKSADDANDLYMVLVTNDSVTAGTNMAIRVDVVIEQ